MESFRSHSLNKTTMTRSSLSPLELKEKGNEAFKKGNYEEALSCYTNALKLSKDDNVDKAIFYKNRAAVYLKQKDYAKVVADTDEALKICPNDPKALFRRCQALEALNRFEEAYRDARHILNVDPTNKEIQPIIAKLHEIVMQRSKENSRVSVKISQMFEVAFDLKTDKEKKETAMNNLLVLARESAGAEVMYKEGITHKLIKLFKLEKNDEIVIPAIRIVGELCKNRPDRTDKVMADIGIPWFLEMLNSNNEERVMAAQHCMQVIYLPTFFEI